MFGFLSARNKPTKGSKEMQKPEVTGFFDPATYTISYVVADPETMKCAIVDSLLDYDNASGRTHTKSADELIAHVRAKGYECEWVIDTHVHADHLTAAPYIKSQIGGKTAIGDQISVVQKVFGTIFNGQVWNTQETMTIEGIDNHTK